MSKPNFDSCSRLHRERIASTFRGKNRLFAHLKSTVKPPPLATIGFAPSPGFAGNPGTKTKGGVDIARADSEKIVGKILVTPRVVRTHPTIL